MITDEEFNSLGDMVEAHIQGARPVEEVQTELLWAILKELRTIRQQGSTLTSMVDGMSYSGAMCVRSV